MIVALAATASSAFAAEICDGVAGQQVTYLSQVTNALDNRVDPGDDLHFVRLRGTLHYRKNVFETLRNKPVIIFNHGHEKERGDPCAIVDFFTAQGWVVFAPLRRGHSLKDDPSERSTGIYIDDFVDYCSRSQAEAEENLEPPLPYLYQGSGFCRPDAPTEDPATLRSAVELLYLRQQRTDVRDAITYIKALGAIGGTGAATGKLADPKRIVIMGHSYGGALMVMTNDHNYGQSVAIDIAGAELSWDEEPYWKIDLEDAMRDQKRPIFIFQAQNGKYLTPTKRLTIVGVNKELILQSAIFPPAPACADSNGDGLCDDNPDQTVFKDIHGNFIGRSQVAIWGPAVIDFANRHPRP